MESITFPAFRRRTGGSPPACFLAFLPVLLLVGVAGVSGEGAVHGTLTLRMDHEGTGTARVVLDIGPTRWVALGSAAFLLRDEVAAPAGYLEETMSLRSPLEEGWGAVAVAAGPLVVGAQEERGVYQRFRDPTAGGVTWSALTTADRFAATTALEEPRTTGVSAVATAPGPWPVTAGAWYLETLNARVTRGAHLRVPLGAGLSLGLTHGASSVDPEGLRDFHDAPWYFTIPPVRSPTVSRQGAFLQLDRRLLRVLMDGWVMEGPFVPQRGAGSFSMTAGLPAFRIHSRVAGAQTGFRTVDLRLPAHSFLAMTMVSWRVSPRTAAISGSLRWGMVGRWSDNLPAPPLQEVEGTSRRDARGTVPWYAAVRLRWRESHEAPHRYDGEASAAVSIALSSHSRGRLTPGVSVGLNSWQEHRLGGSVTLQVPVRRGSARMVAFDLSSRWDGVFSEPENSRWSVRGSLTVPVAHSMRIDMRWRCDGDDQDPWSGSITVTRAIPR